MEMPNFNAQSYLNNTPKIFYIKPRIRDILYPRFGGGFWKMTNTDDEYADDDKKEDADFHGEEKKTSSSRRGMSKSPWMVKRFFTFKSLSLTPGRGQNDAKENNDNEKNKRKCLFVHGWRSNARVSKEHAKHLNLDTKFQ